MNAFLEWLNMGGYFVYVWTAYALAALVLIGNGLNIKRQKKRTRQELVQWFKRRDL